MIRFLSVLAILIASVMPTLACEFSRDDPNYYPLESKGFTFLVSPRPEQIKTGNQFNLTFGPCSKETGFQIQSVTGLMPAHGHGLNYQPKVADDYSVEGLLLHMPGLWQLTIKGQISGEAFTALYEFDLKP